MTKTIKNSVWIVIFSILILGGAGTGLFFYISAQRVVGVKSAFSNDIDYIVYQDTEESTIASTETAIIRPNGNYGPNNWAYGIHYEGLNDIVTYPSTNVGDTNVDLIADTVVGRQEVFDFETIENIKEVKSITLRMYGWGRDSESAIFKTSFDSTQRRTPTPSGIYAWASYEYTGLSLTQNDLDDLWLEFKIATSKGSITYVAYLEVEYVPENFVSGVIDWSSEVIETEMLSWGETDAGVIVTKLSTKLAITGITTSSDIVDCQYFESSDLRGILVTRGGGVADENIYFIIELEANVFDTDYDINYGTINTISYSLSYSINSVTLILTIENTIIMTPEVV